MEQLCHILRAMDRNIQTHLFTVDNIYIIQIII